MTRDGHEMTLGRHDVTQQAQVPVVDVQPIEVEHGGHLLLHALPHRLDPEAGEDLTDVVGARPHRVHVTLSQNLKTIQYKINWNQCCGSGSLKSRTSRIIIRKS